MEVNNITPILVALLGGLGVKEVWKIWSKKIDVDAKTKVKEYAMLLERLTECEDFIKELREENLDLKVKVARLEERLIINAKKRVKSRIPNEDTPQE